MMRLKKISSPFFSLCILLLHVPFVFARNRPPELISKRHMMEFSNAFIAVSSPVETYVSNSSNMYDSLHLNRFGLSREAFEYGIRGFNYLEKKG
jgi:hypothetical protein